MTLFAKIQSPLYPRGLFFGYCLILAGRLQAFSRLAPPQATPLVVGFSHVRKFCTSSSELFIRGSW
jgi:hypothetical protein